MVVLGPRGAVVLLDLSAWRMIKQVNKRLQPALLQYYLVPSVKRSKRMLAARLLVPDPRNLYITILQGCHNTTVEACDKLGAAFEEWRCAGPDAKDGDRVGG